MKHMQNPARRLHQLLRLATLGPRRAALILRVRRVNLTYLDLSALLDLADRVRQLERRRKSGVIVEAGCALGGSAIVLAANKQKLRRLLVYDVFGMIPPPSEADGDDVMKRYAEIRIGDATGIGDTEYYGYQDDLLGKVKQGFASLGLPASENSVSFIKGTFSETLYLDEPIALAHIDCDWYESVTTCLERITPKLVSGGVIIIDDYDAWSGCRRAVDDFFRDKRHSFRFERRSRLHVVKT